MDRNLQCQKPKTPWGRGDFRRKFVSKKTTPRVIAGINMDVLQESFSTPLKRVKSSRKLVIKNPILSKVRI
jgi:hypothetical protein